MKKINNKKLKIAFILLILTTIVLIVFYYLVPKQEIFAVKHPILRDFDGKLIVSATLFPVYDFAKQIGGDKVSTIFILPPGRESHSFVPTDKEYEKMASSSIIFYSSVLAEPWIDKVVQESVEKFNLVSVANNLNDDKQDPHVWLDFTKAQIMVDNIKSAYQSIDPLNADYYQAQADAYKKKLVDLDQDYMASLKACRFRDLIQGGHQAFSYLARRYDLDYFPSQGVFPKTELDMDKTSLQIQRLKASGQSHVYYEELIMPSLADVLRQETGAQMVMLNAAHNVGRYDIQSGSTFITIMKRNLDILKIGLICP